MVKQKCNEKDTLLSILKSKLTLYKEITKKSYMCYKYYITNNIFKSYELNNAFNELNAIQEMLIECDKNINDGDLSVDNLIINLQDINDRLSLNIKNYGTHDINDMIVICFGNEYLESNILINNSIVNYYNFLNDNSLVLNYEVFINEDDLIQEKNVDVIRVKNIDLDSSSFYVKIFGYKLIINDKNQQIVINCIFKDIPVAYINNDIVLQKIQDIYEKKPNSSHFNSKIFKNYIESLSIKSIVIITLNDIYESFLGSISNVISIKSKLLSKLMRDFSGCDMYNQRQILIDLLIDTSDCESKYLAYLLYDILSCDNNNLDSKEQTIIFNSFPIIIQNNFKYAMKSTIDYTKQLMDSDIENKLPLEQRICLMKTSDTVKEKAMMKVKELKSKSDDSSSKVRNYLEGLLKIPFGIYKEESILCIMNNILNTINSNKDKSNTFFDNNKIYTNIDLIKLYHNSKYIIEDKYVEYIQNFIKTVTKEDLNNIINKYNTTYNDTIEINKSVKKNKENILKRINDTKFITNFNELLNNNVPNELKFIITEYEKINYYLNNVDEVLNNSVYGHDNVKIQIKRVIGQWINGTNSGYCFGFEGPPGVGKTSIVKNGIAKCLKDENGEDRPFGFIAIGGSSNGSTLDGHNYTYVGSMWGKIVDILIESKCMNPIIFIDEIDKVSRTESGKELIGILTHLVDPSQNERFQDKYFSGIDLDLSKVLFVFSYNDVEAMDSILLDRIHRVKFKFLSIEDKLTITKKFIIPELCNKMGYKDTSILNIEDETIEFIINEYTCEAGVRKLKEILYEIISEINLNILNGLIESYPIVLTKEIIKNKYLVKRIPSNPKNIHDIHKCGIINGLWANAYGKGGIIQIESQFILSNSMFDLKLTGMQGDVMKESMNVAKTLAWNLTDDTIKTELITKFEKTKTQGIHIHCPEGAVPKDGPSAGTAITVCLYSLLNNIPIDNKIAITGEITLQGCVTAIGGLDLKILGGIKAGVTKFLFPKENSKDFNEFINNWKNKDMFKDITFIEIETIEQALEHSLIK
jgi:ATP-dependent Lon protease